MQSCQRSTRELETGWRMPSPWGFPASNCCRMGASTRVTRAGYARVSEGILTLITACPSLSTGYVGETSHFPDLRGDSYHYQRHRRQCRARTVPSGRRNSSVLDYCDSLTNVTDDPGWG